MNGRADGSWRFIDEESWSGPMNMAFDEVAAETAADRGIRTIRLYRWDPSAVSLGYHQDPDSIDRGYCATEGIDVTRRPTGGGGIYHDFEGDISYSIVVPSDDLPGNLMDSYRELCNPILSAFERMGLEVGFSPSKRPPLHRPACYLREIDPAHDIVTRGDPARKICGNAQHRTREAIVQHGSITYARRVDRQLAVFADHTLTPADFRSRVTSIRRETALDRQDAIDGLRDAFLGWVEPSAGEWSAHELARARTLADRKYDTEEWTDHATDPLDSTP